MDEAGCVVPKMVENGFSPDCFTYNTMINGYCKAGNLGEAFKMMDEMGRKGLKMDTFTLNTIVHKLCTEKLLKEAYKLTVKAAKRGYILDEAVDKLNELLDKGLAPNEATCNMIIHGYYWEEAVEKAFLFYNRMVENSFKSDIITCNILLRGLCKHGMFEKAFNLFNTWIIKGKPVDAVTYNTLIYVLCREGKLDEAFDLMTEMEKKKLGSDRYTYTVIIGALTHTGRTKEAKKFMSKLLETSPNMISEDTSQMLGSSDMDYTEQISNFCTQGKYKEAIKLFQESEQKGTLGRRKEVVNIDEEKMFCCRYVSVERYSEALNILHPGACLQLTHGQVTCGVELASMYVETLVKGKISYDKKTLDLIKKIYQAFPRVPLPQHLWDVDDVQQLSEDIEMAKARVEGCSSFLKAAIMWSAKYGVDSNGSPELHIMLAEYIYSKSPEADIGKVTYHFMRGNDPKKFASTLVNFLGKCYLGEDDLMIARAVLRYLCQGNLREANLLGEEVKTQIESTKIEFPTSKLMQFITYLLQMMERDALPLFNMLRVNYKSSIDREPAFHE
ncbi:hypothetical protein HN873_013179, partial [Arachis hypogaea]